MTTHNRTDDLRLGWSAAKRLTAGNRIRAVLSDAQGLLATSEAVAEAVAEFFHADSASISLLTDIGYRDVVNVGQLGPADVRFPDPDYRYPLEDFPLSTELLLAGTGYLSKNKHSDLFKEYQGMWPQMPAGSFMGVPVISGGQVRGELYLARDRRKDPFTEEELSIARDLATIFGSALPRLLDGE